MSEDKNYLNDLMDLIQENNRKRDEESTSMLDNIHFMGKPFTKQIIQQNPNIPQSDVQDYVENVKSDNMDNMMGAGMASGGIRNLAAPAATRFGSLITKNLPKPVQEVIESGKGKVRDFFDTSVDDAGIHKAPEFVKKIEDYLGAGAKRKANVDRLTDLDSAGLDARLRRSTQYNKAQSDGQGLIDKSLQNAKEEEAFNLMNKNYENTPSSPDEATNVLEQISKLRKGQK